MQALVGATRAAALGHPTAAGDPTRRQAAEAAMVLKRWSERLVAGREKVAAPAAVAPACLHLRRGRGRGRLRLTRGPRRKRRALRGLSCGCVGLQELDVVGACGLRP